jgi:hypothetical protein
VFSFLYTFHTKALTLVALEAAEPTSQSLEQALFDLGGVFVERHDDIVKFPGGTDRSDVAGQLT